MRISNLPAAATDKEKVYTRSIHYDWTHSPTTNN